jgi:hypothetical protein
VSTPGVDQGVLQAALARALADSVTPEVQRQVLEQGLMHYLFAPRKELYTGKETTPLSEAFQKALDAVGLQLAKEVVALPENRAKLTAAVQASFDKAVNSEVVTEKLSDMFVKGFTMRF